MAPTRWKPVLVGIWRQAHKPCENIEVSLRGPYLLVCLLLGCPYMDQPRQVSFHVAAVGDPLTLDPAAASDSESMQVLMQIFDRLVRYREGTMQVEPALATRWTVSADGRQWFFHLRRGVRFHDGTPLDADAVVFSFERQRDRTHPYHFGGFTYWESTFKLIQSVERADRYTVRIRLDRPYAPFLANLAMFPFSIVSPTAMKKYGRGFSQHPVGTGSFRFVRWDRSKRITLARNPTYWDGSPKVDHLIYEVIPEVAQRLMSLQSGTVDVAHGLAPSDRQIIRLHPDLKLFRVAGNSVAYLAMNTQRAPFDNVRIRRAVNHAVDKRAIVKLAYQGLAVKAHGPIPPVMWSHHEKVVHYDFDPTRARAMLEQSGYDFSRRLGFHVMSTPRGYLPSPVLVGRMIARYLANIGMQVDMVIKPFKEHQRATQMGEHDLCLAGWFGDSGDPDNFLYLLLDKDNARKGAARNLAMFTDDKLHELLINGQKKMGRRVRERYYRQAQELVARQAPWVPLAHTDLVVAARRTVGNLQVNPNTDILYRKVVKR
jgi:peptide/nickel transport system substrate-binding protein